MGVFEESFEKDLLQYKEPGTGGNAYARSITVLKLKI